MGRLPHSLPTPQFLPQNTPFISFIALMPSSGHESVSLRALSQLVLHHAAHRERGVALAEQIGQDFSCHLPAQIAHEQPEIGRVPVC